MAVMLRYALYISYVLCNVYYAEKTEGFLLYRVQKRPVTLGANNPC
jgi:hypothetical protein